jgi:enolase
MPTIRRMMGREILDSRGRPTVYAACELASGACGGASAPSGASTGAAEALELRDGDPRRYRGLGCRAAAANLGGAIHAALAGRTFAGQQELDQALVVIDGTPNKSRLGANALLAASLAFARAAASEHGLPLYQYFADVLTGQNREPPKGYPTENREPRRKSQVASRKEPEACDLRPATYDVKHATRHTPHVVLKHLPRLTVNLFSGGKHAGGQVPIQDVLLVPVSARTIDDSLAMVYEVYQAAAELTYRTYGMRALTADEGGLAPAFPSADAMLGDAVAAIRAAGLAPGRDVALAVDVAASHFYRDGRYDLGGVALGGSAMIDTIAAWLDRYPIVSVEDGLSEEDWETWPRLRARIAGRALVLGDDLLCTNPARIRRAIDLGAADALLLKVNQIGTLSEAAAACRLARAAGWRVTISARSGETEDDWLADLAVGWGGDQIKVGSITQSERLAKYNRLLAIEAETDLPLSVGGVYDSAGATSNGHSA